MHGETRSTKAPAVTDGLTAKEARLARELSRGAGLLCAVLADSFADTLAA